MGWGEKFTNIKYLLTDCNCQNKWRQVKLWNHNFKAKAFPNIVSVNILNSDRSNISFVSCIFIIELNFTKHLFLKVAGFKQSKCATYLNLHLCICCSTDVLLLNTCKNKVFYKSKPI